jgi:hypothetical protein
MSYSDKASLSKALMASGAKNGSTSYFSGAYQVVCHANFCIETK